MENLDQQRAQEAQSRISSRFADVRFQGDPRLKQYRTVVKASVVQIREMGLLQTAAFWLSKVKNDRAAEKQVLHDLIRWLSKAPLTKRQAASLLENDDLSRAFLSRLFGKKYKDVILMEAEAIVYLAWLKRLTEALNVSLPKANAQVAKEDEDTDATDN